MFRRCLIPWFTMFVPYNKNVLKVTHCFKLEYLISASILKSLNSILSFSVRYLLSCAVKLKVTLSWP
jgi:hypothetical protein